MKSQIGGLDVFAPQYTKKNLCSLSCLRSQALAPSDSSDSSLKPLTFLHQTAHSTRLATIMLYGLHSFHSIQRLKSSAQHGSQRIRQDNTNNNEPVQQQERGHYYAVTVMVGSVCYALSPESKQPSIGPIGTIQLSLYLVRQQDSLHTSELNQLTACYSTTYAKPLYSSSVPLADVSMDILLDELQCTGSEPSLANCTHNGWRTHDCSHKEDAGVSCVNYLDGAPPRKSC